MGKHQPEPAFGKPRAARVSDTHTMVLYHDRDWCEYIAVVRANVVDPETGKPVIVATYHDEYFDVAMHTGELELAQATSNNNVTPLAREFY